MNTTFSRTLSLVAFLAVFGCGEDEPAPNPSNGNAPVENAGGNTTNGNTTNAVDATAPTVLSTSPEDGAIGQYADVSVEIVFSEPMDPTSVQNALDASDLGEVALEWNTTGDTLTITPATMLEYASGPGDAPPPPANQYKVILDSAASDLAGNRLELGAQVQFDTLREIFVETGTSPDLTNSITISELIDPAYPLLVGDGIDDEAIRSVITFNLWFMPAETVEVTEAILEAKQMTDNMQGAPYDVLGDSIQLDHVSFDHLEDSNAINAAFNTSQVALGTHSEFCILGQEVIEFDVTSDVDDDVANRDTRQDRSQYLLRFDNFTDLNSEVDYAVFSRDDIALHLVYLIP